MYRGSPGALLRLVGAAALAAVVGCNTEPKTAADVPDDCGPEDDAEHAAGVAEQGAKTGGSTAIAGVETFGKSVGGLIEGGTDEAKKQWSEGKAETKKTARAGAQDTKKATKAPKPCDR